jgi:hypothetical protein
MVEKKDTPVSAMAAPPAEPEAKPERVARADTLKAQGIDVSPALDRDGNPVNPTEDKPGDNATPAPAAPSAEDLDAPPTMSEGVRVDIQHHGKAVDPGTGGLWERHGDGKVTFTTRRGKVFEV